MNKRSLLIASSVGIINSLLVLWSRHLHNEMLIILGLLFLFFGSGLLAVAIYSGLERWIIVKPKQGAMIGALSGFIGIILLNFYRYQTLVSSDVVYQLGIAVFAAGTNAIIGLIGGLLIGGILGSKAPKQKFPKQSEQQPDLLSKNNEERKLFFSKSLSYGWSRFKHNFIFWLLITLGYVLFLILSVLIVLFLCSKSNEINNIYGAYILGLLYICPNLITAKLGIIEAHGHKAKIKDIFINIPTLISLLIYLIIVAILSSFFIALVIFFFASHHIVPLDIILGIVFYFFVCRFFFGYYLIIDQGCNPFTALVKGWKMGQGLGFVTPIFFLFLLIINILAVVPYGFGLLISVGWTSIATGYFYVSALPSDKPSGEEVEQGVDLGKQRKEKQPEFKEQYTTNKEHRRSLNTNTDIVSDRLNDKVSSSEKVEVSNKWVYDCSPFLVELYPDIDSIFTTANPPSPRQISEENDQPWKTISLEDKRMELAVAYLGHPTPYIRASTIRYAKKIERPVIDQILVNLLADFTTSIQLAAAEALWGRSGNNPDTCVGVAYAIRCLRDEINANGWFMSRQAAIQALDILRNTRPARLDDFNKWLVYAWCYSDEDLASSGYKLLDIYKRYSTFLGDAENETRQVGEKIGSFEKMKTVHHAISVALVDVSARELEVAWNGIGIWQG